ANEVEDAGLFEVHAVLGGDERHRMLAAARIRHADDGGLLHSGDLIDHFLDLTRVDIHPVDDEHVLLPVGDVEETVAVVVANVPGQEPALAEDPARGFRLIPVAAHDIAAAHADLPRGPHRHPVPLVILHADLDARDRPADRPFALWTADRVETDDGARLAETVAFDQRQRHVPIEVAQDLHR